MSHWSGQVLVDDKVVGHFRYNGTCDYLASTKIYATEDELSDEWRWPWVAACACEGVPVVLRTYDASLMWPGRACMEHRTIVSGYEPTDDAWDSKVRR